MYLFLSQVFSRHSQLSLRWSKFLCPAKLRNYIFPEKCIIFPLFHSLSRPRHSLPSLPRSQGPQQIRGSRAVETHWFKWKEIDVLFTIAVSLATENATDGRYLPRQAVTDWRRCKSWTSARFKLLTGWLEMVGTVCGRSVTVWFPWLTLMPPDTKLKLYRQGLSTRRGLYTAFLPTSVHRQEQHERAKPQSRH